MWPRRWRSWWSRGAGRGGWLRASARAVEGVRGAQAQGRGLPGDQERAGPAARIERLHHPVRVVVDQGGGALPIELGTGGVDAQDLALDRIGDRRDRILAGRGPHGGGAHADRIGDAGPDLDAVDLIGQELRHRARGRVEQRNDELVERDQNEPPVRHLKLMAADEERGLHLHVARDVHGQRLGHPEAYERELVARALEVEDDRLERVLLDHRHGAVDWVGVRLDYEIAAGAEMPRHCAHVLTDPAQIRYQIGRRGRDLVVKVAVQAGPERVDNGRDGRAVELRERVVNEPGGRIVRII